MHQCNYSHLLAGCRFGYFHGIPSQESLSSSNISNGQLIVPLDNISILMPSILDFVTYSLNRVIRSLEIAFDRLSRRRSPVYLVIDIPSSLAARLGHNLQSAASLL